MIRRTFFWLLLRSNKKNQLIFFRRNLLYQGLHIHTVFENLRKSLIHYCERSELRLHFEWTKVNSKVAKMVNFDEFLKT